MKYKQLIGTSFLLVAALISCNKKYDYMGYTPGKGAPVITSVYTMNKTVYYDTTVTTHQSYDSTGSLTSTTDTTIANSTAAFDSATSVGSLGNYYVIHGSNLGAATGVYFNGTQAYFNRSLGTDQTIVVQVPSNTPYRAPLATDTLTVTTLYGTAKYHFTVLAPAPTINATNGVSDYDFTAGGIDTLYGVGFASTDNLFIKGIRTSIESNGIIDPVQIVSVNDSIMVVKFPQTDITQGNLVFAYTQTDGTKDTSISTTVFNNIDKAYQIFTDATQNGWGSWSWGPFNVSTSVYKSGSASGAMTFNGGAWWIDGFRQGGGGTTDGLAYSSDWQYLSFWVKGGVMQETLYLEWGNSGFAQTQTNPITVQPNTWQFFKIAIPTLMWNFGSTNWSANSSQLLSTVAFFVPGNTVDETFYFDNVMLIK
ncbi:hypothetical protein A9P82_13750 [Arachidicoccus ginsenosidimutans]|uniref:hypothetical protein n=1 Tax=Arachidicoccus sp. BS20 TaxID=1850526 RepID=UPI0007F166D5|nr:hypothetical protein [Arachidicoccus sp. BS20]ANI90262.1 hypothetical protein A9P82_13750 [Arachidicoccus sp. BS20]